eukprot:m.12202 g.12202  ORF g.12202 m.12202 type:complete len:272 (-) comp9910_c0_seq1:27-842(-)
MSRGPGTYATYGMSDSESRRVYVSIDRVGPRFQPENRTQARLPGPGHYGIAEAKLEAHHQRSKAASIRGMLDSQGRVATDEPVLGSNLAPGHYSKASIQTLIKPSVGLRGPYDVQSGKRFAKVKPWHSLGPGHYGQPSLDPMSTSRKTTTPALSKSARFGKTGDRLATLSLQHAPRPVNDPGPGHFYTTTASRPATAPEVSFNARHDRRTLFDDVVRQAQRQMTAPAQYNIRTAETTRTTVPGNMSSSVKRFKIPGQSHHYAVERLRSSSR